MGYRRIAMRRQRSITGDEPVGCQVALLMVASVAAIPATFGLSLLLIPVVGALLAGSKSKPTVQTSAELREAWLEREWQALNKD